MATQVDFHEDRVVSLTIRTLSGDHCDDFHVSHKLKHLVESTFQALEIVPAPNEEWLLTHNGVELDLQLDIHVAVSLHFPAGAELCLAPKEGGGGLIDAEVSQRKFAREVDTLVNQAEGYTSAQGWELLSTSFPRIEMLVVHPKSHRQFGFRFQCDRWDEEPPGFSMWDPKTGQDLVMEAWPKNWSAGNHPVTHKPALCLPGVKEYHTHTSHLNDPWENYKHKSSYGLLYIISRVYSKFCSSDDG